MKVYVGPAPERAVAGMSIKAADFADIAIPFLDTGWEDGIFFVQFANNLSVADQAKVKRRCASINANEEIIRERIEVAVARNLEYRALPTKTTAQNAAQLDSLTGQVDGIIRVVLGMLDATD